MGMRADMLVVHVGLAGTLVVRPDVVADRLVLVVVHRAVLRVDCILVSGRQWGEDMQENQDFVVNQAVQHLDKELRHYPLLVDIDEVRDNQERRVVVVGKDDQAEGDMRTVEAAVDRLQPALVLVMLMLVSPMMLF